MPQSLIRVLQPAHDIYGRKIKRRKEFKISTKKKEWNKAAGRSEDDFKTTSKCRQCGRKLIWGSRTYDFDHRDNNPVNNSQSNCYLVCKNCHGKATVIKKIKIKDKITGRTIGYKTIKKKVTYKKHTKKKKTKKKRTKRRSTDPLGIYKLYRP